MPVVFKDSLEHIIAKGSEYLSTGDLDLIRRAYEFTASSFKRIRLIRMSGEPAIIHPIAVAETLTDWRMDGATIAAGILHDVIEDPKISEFQLHATFKDEVSFLIEGVTKLRKFELKTDVDADTAYHHRIFLSAASDIRVAIIKLADRLHNMHTLQYVTRQRQINNCVETQKIFIPLARFLGMKEVKDAYEDIVLKFMNEEGFNHAVEAFSYAHEKEEPFFEDAATRLHKAMCDAGISSRIVRWDYNLAHFHDECMNAAPLSGELLSGFLTVLVRNDSECYPALGVTHSVFEHMKGSFDDCLRFETVDLKRWLETRVHDKGTPFKVRVMTEEMYDVNKRGIIPFLSEPSKLVRSNFLQKRLEEIHDIMHKMKGQGEPSAVEYMTADLFRNEIFVITEKQDRISLPPDCTVLDYAYHLDRVAANNFKRAVVNTRPVSISYRLRSCDKVEIRTDPETEPTVEWLGYVRTPYARSCIKKELRGRTRELAREAGRSHLTIAVNRIGLVHSGQAGELESLIFPVAEFLQMKSLNEFYEAIGYGEIEIEEAIRALRTQRKRTAMLSADQKLPLIATHPIFARTYDADTIATDKIFRGEVYLCECCSPVPGDEINMRTAGRKNLLHRTDCRMLSRRAFWSKKAPATWQAVQKKLFPARLRLKVFHQEDTHRKIRETITENNARFVTLKVGPHSVDGLEMLEIILEVADASMLSSIESQILSLKDVVVVTRI